MIRQQMSPQHEWPSSDFRTRPLKLLNNVFQVYCRTFCRIANLFGLSTKRNLEASFTKEELQAICEALEVDVNEAGRPSTPRMRRLIRAQVGIAESPEATDDGTFRKADPQAIAAEIGVSVDF